MGIAGTMSTGALTVGAACGAAGIVAGWQAEANFNTTHKQIVNARIFASMALNVSAPRSPVRVELTLATNGLAPPLPNGA